MCSPLLLVITLYIHRYTQVEGRGHIMYPNKTSTNLVIKIQNTKIEESSRFSHNTQYPPQKKKLKTTVHLCFHSSSILLLIKAKFMKFQCNNSLKNYPN